MKISREAKIGAVVALTIFLFIYGFNFLKGKNIFSQRTRYYAVYDNINGLTESNPILVHGMNVGSVNRVSFYPGSSTRILVEFTFKNRDLRIPKSSVARIVSSSLLGGMAVDLQLGSGNTYFEVGDTLPGTLQDGLTDEISKQIVPVKEKAERLISTVDSLLKNINSIFNDNAKGNLRSSIQSINKIANEVAALVEEERVRLRTITDNIGSITQNLRKSNDQISRLAGNLANLSDTLVKANVAQTMAQANRALHEAGDILEKINKGEGSLGLLINDKKLYDNLEASSRNLDKLLVDLREHPKRYVSISVFGKKEKPYKPAQ